MRSAGTAVRGLSENVSAFLRTTSRVFPGDIRSGVADCVGNTPLLRLNRLSEETGCEVLGKAEWMSFGGSVKDRAAFGLIKAAEESGRLKKGGTVVEGTAGNTGVGLAHVCRSRGYNLVIYMPNNQSPEKVNLLKVLGAEVRQVPPVPVSDPTHYTFQAKEYAASLPNAVWTDQFDSLANRAVHYETTGPEIWTQTGGNIDAFICATGTGGTLGGTARYLKDVSKGRVKTYLADPPGSVLYSYVKTGKLERSGSSVTEGIGQGRVTKNLEGTPLDGAFRVEDERTISTVYRLIKDEGIFIGASSALNVVAAGDVARSLGPGHTVVTMLCDSASRSQSRLFSRAFLESKGLYTAVPEDCRHLIALQ